MTGTGIVPGNDFTLRKADQIKITIEPIGTLMNTVACVLTSFAAELNINI
jgi:2-dehydro-3-deoxy-D-arabinonate dehydratase